jgi:hypothetical protein
VQTKVCGKAKEAPSVDVTRGEIVEAELGRLIEKLAAVEDPEAPVELAGAA